ncbi:CoA pyrophosphatase [Arthrobacter sp. MYb213]|uniref:NUDIX hydrolase n=1 Tax=Arthrobacter sp. MYb213 TaxID=1848595 RepID=UPI000CFAC688|nr:CoA pyrophosphatase [Arthrobacter sp. MYb213]PRB71531.1 coenzyme A pyrophosphatase [Arthrobacter sp. MYb213]
MSARIELAKVIAAHEQNKGSTTKLSKEWIFAQLDANSVRKAAVLILFGSATAEPVGEKSKAQDLDLLFVERASTLRKHAGQVAFPGGGVDPEDGSAVAAALREAWEETGVQITGIEVLGQLTETELPVSSFLVTPVVGWWHTESKVYAADLRESADVFRAPVAHLLNPHNRLTAVVRRGAQRFKSPAFEYDGHLIWGFTAIVLDRLFDELGWNRPWNRQREIMMG